MYELQQMRSLPLELKVAKTIQRVREFYEYNNGDVYVSFSGGKDSTVLLDIVRSVYPDIKGVFIDTGLEYPEVREFVKTKDNIDILYPCVYVKEQRQYVRTDFRSVLLDTGYPVVSKEISDTIYKARKCLKYKDGRYQYAIDKLNGVVRDKAGNKSKYNCPKWKFLLDAPFKISNNCCNVMKKNPARLYERQNKVYSILGTLADESVLRLQRYLQTGCNSFSGRKIQSKPLSFWTENDILEYIVVNNLDIASVYGDIVKTDNGYEINGIKRTGCMFCMFGVHLEKGLNRFQTMKYTHPKQYEYCLKPIELGGLGMAQVLDFIGVKYD